MKRPYLWKLIFAAAFILAVISLLTFGYGNVNLFTLPFLLVAKGLRELSLSGTLGNIAAIGLFVLLGLLPLILKWKKPWHKEDILLPLCAVTLWYALYYLINPALRSGTLGGATGESILCGTVYSVLLCWGIVKLLKVHQSSEAAAIFQALEIFLRICAAERLLAIVIRFFGFLSTVETVAAANTMPGLDLLPTYIFAFLAFAVSGLAYGLNGYVLLLGAGLTASLREDPYSPESASAAEKASAWCRRSLILITATNLSLNLAQVLFATRLHSLSAQFSFPASSLAVVFALLALSGLLQKGRLLKQDNDLFI